MSIKQYSGVMLSRDGDAAGSAIMYGDLEVAKGDKIDVTWGGRHQEWLASDGL